MLGARDRNSDSDEAVRIKGQLNKLREAVMNVVKFVGDDFVHRAKLESWATVESILGEYKSWGTMSRLD